MQGNHFSFLEWVHDFDVSIKYNNCLHQNMVMKSTFGDCSHIDLP